MNNWKGKHGPLLIAEIGGNHEGDFEYAKELTQLAIESDVDYVKFQIYTGDSLVNPVQNPVRNKHFKKFELTKEEYMELYNMCRNVQIGFMASVWDLSQIEWTDSIMDIFKVGSGDLTAYPVLKEISKTGKPIILSSGLATLEEVKDCIAFIRSCNSIYNDPNYLSVLQCTSMYPINDASTNLNVLRTFKKELDIAIGYSDHTKDSKALELSVLLGAQILEFHFTDTRDNKTFRDHHVSLTKQEVSTLIQSIQRNEILLGSFKKEPLEIEKEHHVTFRRAAYFNRDMKAGEIVEEKDMIYLRPNNGIGAEDYQKIIGKELRSGVLKYQDINWNRFKE